MYALDHMNRKSKNSQFVALIVPLINIYHCSVAEVKKNISINLNNNKLLQVYAYSHIALITTWPSRRISKNALSYFFSC